MYQRFFAADSISNENVPSAIIGNPAGTRIGVRAFVRKAITGSGITIDIRRLGSFGIDYHRIPVNGNIEERVRAYRQRQRIRILL